MSRIIKEFKVLDISKYIFDGKSVGSPVFFSHRYGLEDICGKVVYISHRRQIINIEFYKFHPLFKILKETEPKLELDIVHTNGSLDLKTVEEFVVYLNHGKNNV